MRRSAFVLLAAIILSTTAWAQLKMASIPLDAVRTDKALAGREKARYLMRQLDLTEDQLVKTRNLVRTVFVAEEGPRYTLDQLQALMADVQAARDAGDEARVVELEDELRGLVDVKDEFPEFERDIRLVLTDEQKTQFDKDLDRLGRNPSGALRPIDVYRVLAGCKLERDQQLKVEAAFGDYRTMVYGVKSFQDVHRFQAMNALLDKIIQVLNDDQERRFRMAVLRLRPDFMARRLQLPDDVLESPLGKPGRKKNRTADDEDDAD